jgi:hypothetical protein
MPTRKEKDAVLKLIEQECGQRGFALEPMVIKKASLLNISSEDYHEIKQRLVSFNKINEDQNKLFIFK